MIISSIVESTMEEMNLVRWYVMRDLKRSNAKLPAYKILTDLEFEVFTPMVWKLVHVRGKSVPKKVPFIPDLLFVHNSRAMLDPIVDKIATLQYRFLRDGHRTPMIIDEKEMERFINVVKTTENPQFYSSDDIKPNMVGKYVRIVGGLLNGYEGRLQKLQGSRVKRLFVELPNLLTVAVEVQPEFIQLI